jgi:hypothetical protein
LPRRISLALAFHNHQPVGNFGFVFADVYDHAYLPMLSALERHPSVRLSLHYTGALLDWLRSERPDFLDRLAALIHRGQVELMGGGYYEPVLASLPERDRVGQLLRMADEVEALSGERPRGAWLAERVWEPDLPTSLAAAGYRWTILDDAHFRAAAIPEENLWGAYTTEDQGRLLTVFGSEQYLRYAIPFGEVSDVIRYLQDHATDEGERVGVMGDDGEKFGGWPTTYKHSWGEGRWVDRFFHALETSRDWLTTVTPSEWLEREPPIGRVYIPTSSYAEMGEWALPAEESRAFAEVLHADVAARRPEARWLRGGFWRNFQVKYREVNDLHKQMLRTSEMVTAMPDGPARALALDHLYQGQSNDCYWHGLFGGIYLPHMRLATYGHLIAAEDAAEQSAQETGVASRDAQLLDIDLDGRDEVLLTEPGQVVGVKLDEGAGIGRWDIRAVRHALTSVMRRRPEAYHWKLLEKADKTTSTTPSASAEAAGTATLGGSGDQAGALTPASIHDIVASKETGLSRYLRYDAYERRSGLVHLLVPDLSPESFAEGRFEELGDFVDRPFEVVELAPGRLVVTRDGSLGGASGQAVQVEKRLALGGGRREPALVQEVTVRNRSDAALSVRVGVEWALTMLGGGGNPAAFHEIAGVRAAHDSSGSEASVEHLSAGNTYIGITVSTTLSPPGDVWWSTIETVSNSEAGFERIYQGSCVLLSWPVQLGPGGSFSISIAHRVSTDRDAAVDEAPVVMSAVDP